jgi:hypothetical protein
MEKCIVKYLIKLEMYSFVAYLDLGTVAPFEMKGLIGNLIKQDGDEEKVTGDECEGTYIFIARTLPILELGFNSMKNDTPSVLGTANCSYCVLETKGTSVVA